MTGTEHLKPTASSLMAVMVTRRCNMTCSHCSVESAPRVSTTDPSEAELLHIIREAASAGIKAIQFTGGEPMMRQKLVLKLMAECRRLGMTCGLTTNGFWGKDRRKALQILRQMLRQNLRYMAVSYDRYHAEFMGPEPILNLADAARDLGFSFNVNVTRTLKDENLDGYAGLFGNLPNVRMRLYDVQAVGRARQFELESLRTETEGFCNSAAQPTITEDGRLIACNGPAYFDNDKSPRTVGNCANEPIATLLNRHWNDPILETIRTCGPAGLRDELLQETRFTGAFNRRFAGQCDLCHFITGNPEMVETLHERLADSSHQAMRAAKWAVIHGTRNGGELSRTHANGAGFASAVYQRIASGSWPQQAARIFGRADIDWDHQAQYLSGCGLAGQLASAVREPEIARWSPAYFSEGLNRRAVRDALRELSHREALEKIHEALVNLNLRGVLLKGSAYYLLEQVNGVAPGRIPGDIDIWIQRPSEAEMLRQYLIDHDFLGEANAPRTGPHHLAPVMWRSSMVEIHTGIMPRYWGLPETDMYHNSIPLQGWSAFHTLSPSDMILHEAMHITTHLYSFGLKLALDIRRIRQLANITGHPVDWTTIAERAGVTHCRKAFWAPILALHASMKSELDFPDDFIRLAPHGESMRRMVLVASRRMFTATDYANQMNPFTRNGIFLLLQDNMIGRLRYLAALAHGEAAESRRTALHGTSAQSYGSLGNHLKHAWFDLKRYRRAIAKQESS